MRKARAALLEGARLGLFLCAKTMGSRCVVEGVGEWWGEISCFCNFHLNNGGVWGKMGIITMEWCLTTQLFGRAGKAQLSYTGIAELRAYVYRYISEQT